MENVHFLWALEKAFNTWNQQWIEIFDKKGTKAACVRILSSFGVVFFFLAPVRLFSESTFDLRLEKIWTRAVIGVVKCISDGVVDLPFVESISCHDQTKSEFAADVRLKISIIATLICGLTGLMIKQLPQFGQIRSSLMIFSSSGKSNSSGRCPQSVWHAIDFPLHLSKRAAITF